MTNEKAQNLRSYVKQFIPVRWLKDIRISYRMVMEAVNDIESRPEYSME